MAAKGIASGGFTVHCCQLAGHCGTEEDLLATTWQQWYASVEAALSKLEAVCDTIIVGGLSIGAILALRLAALQPERVHGVACFAPTLWYDGWTIPRTNSSYAGSGSCRRPSAIASRSGSLSASRTNACAPLS